MAPDAEPSSKPPIPPPRPRMAGRDWGLILVLAAINFTHVVDFVIVMPLGGQLMRELNIDTVQAAHVVSAYGIAAAVTGVLAAGLLDRYTRKKMLLFGYTGFTVATLLCGVAGNYEWLLLARVLAGAFGGLTGAGIMAMIGDVFEDARRGTATGAVMSAFAVGSILGLPIGLTLAGWYGWGAPFLALGGLSAVVLAVAAVLLPTGRQPGPVVAGRPSAWATLLRVASHPGHARALAFTGLVVFAAFVMIPNMGPYFEANLGLHGQLPTVYAVAGVCTLVSMNLIGRWADRRGKRPVFVIMASCLMVMTLVITNLPPVGVWAASGVAALFMVCGSGRMVPAQALVISCVRPADRGAFMSLNTAVQSVALGLASDLGGRIVTRLPDGHLAGYPAAGAVAFVLTGLTLVMVRAIKPVDVGPVADVRLDRPEPAAGPEPKPAAV